MENLDLYAIGVVFSSKTLDNLVDRFNLLNIELIAEGTLASGYEMYLTGSQLKVAEKKLVELKSENIKGVFLFDRPHKFSDGSRYDRLLALFKEGSGE